MHLPAKCLGTRVMGKPPKVDMEVVMGRAVSCRNRVTAR